MVVNSDNKQQQQLLLSKPTVAPSSEMAAKGKKKISFEMKFTAMAVGNAMEWYVSLIASI
jgi:hypothetical protein